MSNAINTTNNVIIPQSEIDNCPICFESLTDNIKTLLCNHKLCNICYGEILNRPNPKCPQCRQNIIINQNMVQNHELLQETNNRPETSIGRELLTFELNNITQQILQMVEENRFNHLAIRMANEQTTLLFHCCNFRINIEKSLFFKKCRLVLFVILIIFWCYMISLLITNNMEFYCDNKTIQCDYYKTTGTITNTEIYGNNVMYSFAYDNNNVCYEYVNNIKNNTINEIGTNTELFILKKDNYECITNYKLYNPSKIYFVPVFFGILSLWCVLSFYYMYIYVINE